MVTVEVYQTEQMETPFKLTQDTPFLKKSLVLIFQKFQKISRVQSFANDLKTTISRV